MWNNYCKVQSTLHILSTLYSEHLHIVNNIGKTFQWRFMGIVSLCSEQKAAANCVHYMESWLYSFSIFRMSPSLNVDHLVAIMGDFYNTEDWLYSFRWIPPRLFKFDQVRGQQRQRKMEAMYKVRITISWSTWLTRQVSSMIPSDSPASIDHYWSTLKHKLEKWFIISGDGVRPSVQNKTHRSKSWPTFQASALVGARAWIIVRLKSRFHFIFVLCCEIWKVGTNGRTTTCENISLVAEWINYPILFLKLTQVYHVHLKSITHEIFKWDLRTYKWNFIRRVK